MTADGPLADLRVIDLSTVIAGPNCARYLADFGADVIKVERPGGDSLRTMAWRDERDGEGLWWKLANRNKRTIVLDLKDDADRDAAARPRRRRRTCSSRTSGPARSSGSASAPTCCSPATRGSSSPGSPGSARTARTPSGPGSPRSPRRCRGFAAINGEPDGQPLLPPIALTDEVDRAGRGVRHDGRAAQRRAARSSTSTCWRRCST